MSETPEPTRPTLTFQRTVSRREAGRAFKRLASFQQGQVVRFGLGARLEHLLLLVTVAGLAVTGFVQTFITTDLARQILLALGGLEAVQGYHHLFGLVLIALGIYHGLNVLDSLFVRRESGTLLPGASDFQQILANLKLNLGLSKKLPLYDRYSFDEKFIYWVSVIAVGVMAVTGLVLWFPVYVTQILPGSFYPYATVFHRWQAVFLVAVVLLLHIYQVLLRTLNFSIFTGKLSLQEMEIEHPVELAYLKQAAAVAHAKNWPQTIRFSVEERLAHQTVTVIEEFYEDEEEVEPVEIAPEAPVAPGQPEPVAANLPVSGETVQ